MAKDNKTRTVIIEDNEPDMNNLLQHLEKYPHIEVVGTADNGAEGLEIINDLQPDVVFLDVELPDINGLSLIDQLDEKTMKHCNIVVYTAYIDYSVNSFRKKAFDVLLKPIEENDFAGIIKRLYDSPAKDNDKEAKALKKNNNNLLMFTNTTDFQLVRLQDIGVFEYDSDNRVWMAHIALGKTNIKLKRNVTNKMLLKLGPQFIQVHQRFIINSQYLFGVEDNNCIFFPPFQKITHVKVGTQYRKKLITQFINF